MNVGVLTSGGDCPGLNAVIRAVVRKAKKVYGDEVFGFHDSWKGVMAEEYELLDIARLRGTLPRGGTILGTSRETPFMTDDGLERCQTTISKLGIEAMVVIGGEGSLSCAHAIHEAGIVPVVGVPKTIDNDVALTDQTFGFDTAVSIATDAIDRLHTTAESHDRVMVVEVMGRHVGHIATWAGLAGGATLTLIPEEPFDIEAVSAALRRRHEQGKYASIIVVAEGARPIEGTLAVAEPSVDAYGHKKLGGIANVVASEIEQRTGYSTRVTVLGHVQRGGTPTPFDRVLCSRYGIAAIEAVHDGAFDMMVALKGQRIERVPLADVAGSLKYVNPQIWSTAKEFFA